MRASSSSSQNSFWVIKVLLPAADAPGRGCCVASPLLLAMSEARSTKEYRKWPRKERMSNTASHIHSDSTGWRELEDGLGGEVRGQIGH